MQFNSVKRGNFSGLARSVNRATDQVFDSARTTSVDHTAIAKESIKGRSMERRAAMEAEGKVSRAGLEAVSKTKQYKDTADALVSEGKQKGKKARMAGVVGALGSLATGVVVRKDREADKRDRDQQALAEERRHEQLMAMLSRPRDKFQFDEKPPENPNLSTPVPERPEGSVSPSASSKPTKTKPTAVSTYSSLPLAGSSDVSSLTPEDYKHLAFAISSEAGPGKDRYGVAASILNRVKSDKWPGTVKDVIYQDGQYEGVYKGLSVDSPNIAADLSSSQGQQEIIKALEVLDGRTDFKGQSMLKYRSNKGNKGGIMDPMFDPKGNFFHYSHQT